MDTTTDADLIAAIHRGIAEGSLVEVTDEWLAAQRAEFDTEDAEDGGPVVTWTDSDTWSQRRYYVDGREVTTVRATEPRRWQCSPDHRMEWRGVTEYPIGEHVAGCGWMPVTQEYAVHLAGYNGGPRYYAELSDAYAAAERHVASARRCSLPVRARLCRLLKRHDGPCVPWD